MASSPFRSSICFLNANCRRLMKYKYDVFPSFRGSDVRKGFVDHLDRALTSTGFRAFLDTRDVNRGEDISRCLEHAIEDSQILIPIFSPNYAQSSWCLRESSLIAREVRKGSAIAIPLFYDVSPSQVRRPELCGGPYAVAFQEHRKSGRYSAEEISEWKDALFQLCRLSGYSLQDDFNGYQAALVKRVVEEVAKHCKKCPAAEHCKKCLAADCRFLECL